MSLPRLGAQRGKMIPGGMELYGGKSLSGCWLMKDNDLCLKAWCCLVIYLQDRVLVKNIERESMLKTGMDCNLYTYYSYTWTVWLTWCLALWLSNHIVPIYEWTTVLDKASSGTMTSTLEVFHHFWNMLHKDLCIQKYVWREPSIWE